MPLSIKACLHRGFSTSKEIQSYTGLSQATVARQLRDMNHRIVKVKHGRTTRYALTCNAFGGDDKLPLSIIDAYGNTVLIARIRPLVHGGFFVEPVTGMPPLFLGERGNGVYEDLPYFLYDLRPQGFLGRKITEKLSKLNEDFPPDPRRWTTDHIGKYIVSNSDDLPGNLKFGAQALVRVRRKPVTVTEDDYPDLAEDVLAGDPPESSAGGEQPKFTAFCANQSAHVIVKFSPKEDNAVSRRWRDILITEFYATECLHIKKLPAAEARLIDKGGRLFLESQRFDRSGEYGRMSMVSLFSIDAEFVGLGSTWPKVVDALAKKKLVNKQHLYDTIRLWIFGLLINNTDMHLGNLSFAVDGSVFRLLPVYDMCSMGFAPRSGGETIPYNFTPSLPDFKENPVFNNFITPAKEMARDFWDRVSKDYRISPEFKNFLLRGNPIDVMDE